MPDMVYRGDPKYIHVPDGQRSQIGFLIRLEVERLVKNYAGQSFSDKPICPGCYMVVIFNAAIQLAMENGQSISELGNTLGKAFKDIAECAERNGDVAQCVEEIDVILDPN